MKNGSTLTQTKSITLYIKSLSEALIKDWISCSFDLAFIHLLEEGSITHRLLSFSLLMGMTQHHKIII
jgi:hypothetical protein